MTDPPPPTDHNNNHPTSDDHDHDHNQVGSSLSFIDQMLMNMDGLDDDSLLWDPLLILSDDDDNTNNNNNNTLFWGTPVPSLTDHHDGTNTRGGDYQRYEVGSSSTGGGDVQKRSGDDQGMDMGHAAPDNNQDVLTMAPAPLQVWAPQNDNVNPTVPNNSCSCCQVLREIIHTNGIHTTKFEIHGRVGLVSHAVLENHYASCDGLAPITQDCQMLDFCRQSLENIKEYMKWYLEDHRQKGYILLQEPLSFYYETLCTGYDWVNTSESRAQTYEAGTSNQGAHPPLEVPSYPMELPPMASQQASNVLKTELAIQRERIKNMTIVDFAKYFDTPIEAAAKQLRLCATVIKKKLRSFNISRWPYRKVRSIKRKITLWSKELEVEDPEARARAETEIGRLQQQVDEILSGNIEVLNSIPNTSTYD